MSEETETHVRRDYSSLLSADPPQVEFLDVATVSCVQQDVKLLLPPWCLLKNHQEASFATIRRTSTQNAGKPNRKPPRIGKTRANGGARGLRFRQARTPRIGKVRSAHGPDSRSAKQ